MPIDAKFTKSVAVLKQFIDQARIYISSLGPGPAPAAPHIANDVPQPQEEVALGIVIWNDAPMSSST